MRKSDTKEISVSLPIPLLAELNTICTDRSEPTRQLYGKRSQIIQEAINDWLDKHNKKLKFNQTGGR